MIFLHVRVYSIVWDEQRLLLILLVFFSAVAITKRFSFGRVATNLENLEYSDFSEHGKLGEFSGNSVQPQGKIVTSKSIFSLSFKYLCKTAVDWVNRIIRISGSGGDLLYCWSWCGMTVEEDHYYIYFLLQSPIEK